jgi:hypothetical protein
MASNHIAFITLHRIGERHRGLFFYDPLTQLGRHLLHITAMQRQYVGNVVVGQMQPHEVQTQ